MKYAKYFYMALAVQWAFLLMIYVLARYVPDIGDTILRLPLIIYYPVFYAVAFLFTQSGGGDFDTAKNSVYLGIMFGTIIYSALIALMLYVYNIKNNRSGKN